MEFSTVTVIAPKGNRFRAQVNLEASADAILEGLVRKTELPPRDKNNRPIKYRLCVVGDKILRDGGTVRIEVDEPPAVGDVEPIS